MTGQSTTADPYFPDNGDPRYRVHRYELALEYRPGPNRLAGTARLSAIAGPAPLAEFHLNLAAFRIGRVLVDGRAPHYTHRAAGSASGRPRPCGPAPRSPSRSTGRATRNPCAAPGAASAGRS